jgi:hypothetical protein
MNANEREWIMQRWTAVQHDLSTVGGSATQLRVITTTYIGATESRAVEKLASLPGVELKISLDGQRSRQHPLRQKFRDLPHHRAVHTTVRALANRAVQRLQNRTVLNDVDSASVTVGCA